MFKHLAKQGANFMPKIGGFMKNDIRKNSIINIEDRSIIGHPRVVRMSFELPYLDWCRFENSELFQNLKSYLEELQTQDIQIPFPK